MKNKIALIKRKLKDSKVDGLLITDLLNVKYLTGFTGSAGYAVVTPKDAVFVTDFRYQEQSRYDVKGFEIRIERTDRAKEIKALSAELGIKKLGFEDHHLTTRAHAKLLKQKLRLKPLTDVVESMRAVKLPEETERIRKAAQRAERAFRRLQPFIRVGITEQKLARKLEDFLREEGCKSLPFGVIVASGFLSAHPHARPSGKAVRAGDFIVFDWGGEYEGYYSDMSRTVVMKGGDTARQREIYSIVFEAQKRAIASVRANIRAKTVDAAARDYITHKGYGEEFGHGTGHGVGLAVHEKPSLSWRSRDVISERMVFTIEPGIYIPGFGGVRIEDMVVATKSGAEVLTSLPKKFKVIG